MKVVDLENEWQEKVLYIVKMLMIKINIQGNKPLTF